MTWKKHPGTSEAHVSRHRPRAAVAATTAVTLGLGGLALGAMAGIAHAAVPPVPSFPNNLVIFPDRDFMAVEGYSEYAGKDALVQVTRDGGVVGSAISEVSGTDVAFEINHPGGVCWGAGTDLQVTPNIIAGDTVILSLKDAGGNWVPKNSTVVGDAGVDKVIHEPGTTHVEYTGHFNGDQNPEWFEQRTINPGLRDAEETTLVGKRDVRALLAADYVDSEEGYLSYLTTDPATDTFHARYDFLTVEAADMVAEGGGERAMTWQTADADGNRQGITINERGEHGGPGMGGCPVGPAEVGPVAPTNVSKSVVSPAGVMTVDWAPAKALPGTPAITGYRVRAIAPVQPNGDRTEHGVRVNGVARDTVTLTGLQPGVAYAVEIVSVDSTGRESTQPAHDLGDTKAPTLTASLTPLSATEQNLVFTASEAVEGVYYTVDGTPVISAGVIHDDNRADAGTPITIPNGATVNAIAVDLAGNQSTVFTNQAQAPGAPTDLTVDQSVPAEVKLSWKAPVAAPGAHVPAITEYVVESSSLAAPVTVPGTTVTITGLDLATVHQFTVKAVNSAGSGPVSAAASTTPTNAVKAVATAPSQVVRGGTTAGTTISLDGTGSTSVGGTTPTYKWEQLSGPAGTITNPNSATASFNVKKTLDLAKATGPAPADTLEFRLTVSNGSKNSTADVTVKVVSDTVSITKTTWKSGELRVQGTAATGATVRLYGPGNPARLLGSATVAAGAFEIRVKGNTVPAVGSTVFAASTAGGYAPVR